MKGQKGESGTGVGSRQFLSEEELLSQGWQVPEDKVRILLTMMIMTMILLTMMIMTMLMIMTVVQVLVMKGEPGEPGARGPPGSAGSAGY